MSRASSDSARSRRARPDRLLPRARDLHSPSCSPHVLPPASVNNNIYVAFSAHFLLLI
jgi:hypothetical protein